MTSPNPFAEDPQPKGALRLQSAGDPLDPYTAPAEVAEEKPEPAIGIWRDGELLVIHDWVASLPNRCVFTNELFTVRCRQQLSWNYAIDWRSRHFVLNFGVAVPIHRQMVRWRNRWMLAGAVAAAPALIALALLFFGYSFEIVFGPILISLFAGLLLQRAKHAENVFKIRTFHGSYFWLTGAGQPFLDSLPMWPGIGNR